MAEVDPNKRLTEYLEAGTKQLRDFLQINVVSGHEREIDRMTKYYLYWNFYDGNHYRDYNDSMLAFNYVRTIIDKVNNFLLGESAFSFSVATHYNDTIGEELSKKCEELLMYHWRRNKKTVLAHEMLQMGSVCGDCWIMPYWDEKKKYVVIRVLDSRQSYPEFKDGDTNNVSAFQVRTVLDRTTNKDFAISVIRYSDSKVQRWKQKTSALITKPGREKIGNLLSAAHEDVHDYEETENTLGFIPIVHIKNKPKASSYYSVSDANDILKINKVFNEMNQEMKTILDYYVSPVTVVTGATIKNMKRGIGSIWSGLPPEANVFNLGLDADVSSMSTFLKDIKSYIHEISDVPDSVLGKTQAISGTSAAALKLTYQPLVQQADKKALTYGDGITEINNMILKIIAIYDKENTRYKKILDLLKQEEEGLTIDDIYIYPVFTYGFPLDRAGILQEGQMERQLGIGTRKELANRLGKNNVGDLLDEVDQETMHLASIQTAAGMMGSGTGGEQTDTSNQLEVPESPTKNGLENTK